MDTSTIGLIGSGKIGSALARLSVAAGHQVVLSNSRGPETLAELVAELGPNARAATPAEAAEAADVAVVTVPLLAYAQVPVEPLAGKVVIDTNNYYPERDGAIAALDDLSATTSQLLQEHLPTSHVVKGFNNIFHRALSALARPDDPAARSVLPIYGDSSEAKGAAARYMASIGYDALDSGALADSWRSENGKPAYVYPYSVDGDVYAFQRVDADTMTALLAKASRDEGEPRTASSPR